MRQDTDQDVSHDGPRDGPGPSADRLSVPEAAERLGVTQDAIRKRVKRGYIAWEKDLDGRLYVWVNRNETRRETSSDTSSETSRDDVVSELRERVHLLERELSAWQEEARRKDHLLAAALERIPQIEAPPEPRESPLSASAAPAKGEEERRADDTESQKRSWWQRMFGS